MQFLTRFIFLLPVFDREPCTEPCPPSLFQPPFVYKPSKPEIFLVDGKIAYIAINHFSNRYVFDVRTGSRLIFEPASNQHGIIQSNMSDEEFKQFRDIIVSKIKDPEKKEQILRIIESALRL